MKIDKNKSNSPIYGERHPDNLFKSTTPRKSGLYYLSKEEKAAIKERKKKAKKKKS